MDGGLKGGTHRVHYYDDNEDKVVIKLIISKMPNQLQTPSLNGVRRILLTYK